jgi:hypothetical protein
MSSLRFEPWLLNEKTAKILRLPTVALTPTAQLAANSQEGSGLIRIQRWRSGKG